LWGHWCCAVLHLREAERVRGHTLAAMYWSVHSFDNRRRSDA